MSTVIGYGKSKKGKVIHAILKGGIALCDKRMTNVDVAMDLGAMDVTCAKCKAHKEVKYSGKQPKIPMDAGVKDDDDTKPSGLPVAKGKQNNGKVGPGSIKDLEKKQTDNKVTQHSKKKKKKKEKGTEFEFDFVSQETAKGFNIYHKPSRRVFFESIPGSLVDLAVGFLNDLEIRWTDVNKSVPVGFISSCKEALTAAYEEAGLVPPQIIAEKDPQKKGSKKKVEKNSSTRKFQKGDELVINEVIHIYDGKSWKPKEDKPEPKKPKRKITRRKKKTEDKKSKRKITRRDKKPSKEKRKIKRREKVEKDRFGFKSGMQPAEVVKMITGPDGAEFGEIVDMLKSQFSLEEKRAKRKAKRVIYKLSREFGAEVIVVLSKNEDEDHYILREVEPVTND